MENYSHHITLIICDSEENEHEEYEDFLHCQCHHLPPDIKNKKKKIECNAA